MQEYRFKPDEQIAPAQLDALIRQGEQTQPVLRSSEEVLEQRAGGMRITPLPGQDYEPYAKEMYATAFLAQIRFVGPRGVHDPPEPDDQPDFADARYWVREIDEKSTTQTKLDDPLKLTLDINKGPPPAEGGEETPRRTHKIRWLVATNLGEVSGADRENEAHSLGLAEDTDDGAIVQVTCTPGTFGRARYCFTSAPGSGASRFCMIATEREATDNILDIYWVKTVTIEIPPEEPGDDPTMEIKYKITKQHELILAWPGMKGRHFKGLAPQAEPGDYATDRDNILEAVHVDGVWHVKPVPRYVLMKPAPTINASDCQPQGMLE